MLIKNISIIYRHGSAFIQRVLPDQSINCTDQGILSFLSQQNGVNQDTIGKSFQLNKTSITKALTRLEELNLIERTINTESKREKFVTLTDSGWKKIISIQNAREVFEKKVLEDLSEEERNTFRDLSKRVACKAYELNHQKSLKECD